MPINRAGFNRFAGTCAFAGAVLVLAGCVENGPRAESAKAQEPVGVARVEIGDGPGVPMRPDSPSVDPSSLGEGKVFAIRSDPFALSAIEANFNRAQFAESLLTDMPWNTPDNFSLDTDSGVPRIIVEPVPRWRLSGIIIANGVLGILDRGPGTESIQIRPGTKIPGTEWIVVSIDSERAILRRDGNKRPSEFAVNLQGPLSGQMPSFGGGGGGGGGGGDQGPRGGGPGVGPP